MYVRLNKYQEAGVNLKDQPVDEKPEKNNYLQSAKKSQPDVKELSRLLEDANAQLEVLKAQLANQQLNETRFQLISTNTPDTILFQDTNLIYTWVLNTTPFITPDQIIGKSDFDILPPADAKRITRIKKDLLREGGSFSEEIHQQDGDISRYFSILLKAWKNDRGEIIGIATYSRDITGQKKAEKELREQLIGERLLEEITEQFLKADIARSNEQIPSALEKMAGYLKADLGFVRFVEPDTKMIQRGYEWKNPEFEIFGVPDLNLSFEILELTKKQLENNQPIFVPEIFTIPDEGQNEKIVLAKLGLNSLVMYPLWIFGDFKGYIGFGAKKAYSFWSERERGLLGLFQSTICNVLERCEREYDLRQSQELYQKILELSPNAIFLVQDDTLLYTNPAGARLTGYDVPQEINGKSIENVFTPEIIRDFLKLLPQPQTMGKAIHGEISIKTKKNGIIFAEFSSLVFNINGKPAYLVIGVDTTHRKQIEYEIEENRKFLNEILSISPMAIFVYDREKNKISYFNPAANKILGLSSQQLSSYTIPQFISHVHPNDFGKAVKMSEKLGHLPSGEVLEGEYRWICPNGEVRWLHSFQVVIANNLDGTAKQTLSIFQDLSETKKALQKLRQSEDKYHRLVEDVPGIVYQAKSDEVFTHTFLSDYYTKLTSIDKNSLINNKVSTWLNQVHPDDREKMLSGVQKAVPDSSSFEIEYRLLKADGSYLWVKDRGRIICDEENKPLFINGIITDISAQKRDYEAMRQLSQDNLKLLAQARRDAETKTLLLNEVNHRVKNNIASIIGLIELESQREIQSDTDLQATLFNIKTRITGLATVHDILSSNQWAPVKLDLFIRKVIDNAASSYPIGRKITVNIICPDHNIWINSRQGTALALIINELTTNSIRHAFAERQNGTITVSIDREPQTGHRLQISFADDGPGWPDEILNGKVGNVGMQVMRLSAVSPLYGDIQFRNRGGAVAIITFNLIPQIINKNI